jgi:hypothetical protein
MKNLLTLELKRAGDSLNGWSSIDMQTHAKYSNITKFDSLVFVRDM